MKDSETTEKTGAGEKAEAEEAGTESKAEVTETTESEETSEIPADTESTESSEIPADTDVYKRQHYSNRGNITSAFKPVSYGR